MGVNGAGAVAAALLAGTGLAGTGPAIMAPAARSPLPQPMTAFVACQGARHEIVVRFSGPRGAELLRLRASGGALAPGDEARVAAALVRFARIERGEATCAGTHGMLRYDGVLAAGGRGRLDLNLAGPRVLALSLRRAR